MFARGFERVGNLSSRWKRSYVNFSCICDFEVKESKKGRLCLWRSQMAAVLRGAEGRRRSRVPVGESTFARTVVDTRLHECIRRS